MPRQRAFITGVTGQDGAYLASLLLVEGCEVFGSARPASSPWRLTELGIEARVARIDLDLQDFGDILAALRDVRPMEVYNLAAQSTIEESEREPILAGDLNGLAAGRLLEAIRAVDPRIRFAQASSSQMFGRADAAPQNEKTPFRPHTPYGIAKLYAHLTTGYYRETHGIHACSGILFNHESPLRGSEFVTRKISQGMAALAGGASHPIELGNLRASRDWGHARDYMRALVLSLRHPPADYVLATGRAHTVAEFADAAAVAAGFDLVWERDHGTARDRRSGRTIVEVKPELVRAEEGAPLIGDAARARRQLGWSPSIDFPELVREMVEADLDRLSARATSAQSVS